MGRFVLRTARPRKDGRVTLTYNGYVDGKRFFYGTGLAVRPEDWDDMRQQVKRSDLNYAHVNAQLRDINDRFEREALARKVGDGDVDVTSLKTLLSRRTKRLTKAIVKEHKFWEYFAHFLATKKDELEPRTIAKYNTLKVILKEVEKGKEPLKFEGIDHNFYDRFRNHMIKKRKLTNNTIGKYVSTLKTFLSWAQERGAPVHPSYRKFRVDEEEVEVVALTWDELELLTKVDLSTNPRLDRVRDLFLLECYTGARFGDIQAMHYDDIRDGVWCLRQQKTKTEVRIHISTRAEAIINKYRSGGSPLPSISSQNLNKYVKELGKTAGLDTPFRQVRRSGKTSTEKRGPKWEFLSSHVARKTFVSISLERGMRYEVVMSFTGHKSFKTMRKYIALNEKGRKEDVERVWG